MPIPKKAGETKDEWMGKCIGIEINNGKDPSQAAAICYAKWEEFAGTQSVTDNTWSTESPISVNMAKVSIDYDGTLSTSKGKEMAKRLIDSGDTVYIISARSSKEGMLAIADELGIPHSRVFATGSNKAKAEKVKELGITKHIDNNSDVVKSLPNIGEKFARVRRVIFSEDFNEDVIREYKEAGFKVHILSKRKVQRKDRKTYNKLKSVGLSEDNLLFGDIKDLDNKYNFDVMLHDTEDPILNALLTRGEDISKKKVISSTQITNMSEALQSLESVKNIDIKFASVRVVFTYELRDDVTGPSELTTTRDFCKRVLGANKAWSIDDINSLPTSHLTKMGLPTDIFAFRGGFYTTKGGQRGVDTTPFCRHIWKSKVIMD